MRKQMNDKQLYDVTQHLLSNWAKYERNGTTFAAIAEEVTEAMGFKVSHGRVSKIAKQHGLPQYGRRLPHKAYGSKGRELARIVRDIVSVLESDFTDIAVITVKDREILKAIINGEPLPKKKD